MFALLSDNGNIGIIYGRNNGWIIDIAGYKDIGTSNYITVADDILANNKISGT